MKKRERLENAISGATVDRVPVSLWRHWPGDDQRAADLAQAHIAFQARYDWDFLVAVPSSHAFVTGYGLQDQWQGDTDGQRQITRRPIQHSLDWTDLRPIEPKRGDTGKQIQALQLLAESPVLDDTPLLQIVYSPLTQALQLAGRDALLRHIRTRPDRLKTGLNTLTESTLRFVDALQQSTHIAGICLVNDTACYTLLSEDEFRDFGLPYDRKVLQSLPPAWWLNMIQLTSDAPMLHLFENIGAQILSWRDVEGRPPLERVNMTHEGAYCAGFGESTHLNFGTPTTIRDRAREVQLMHNQRRIILGCGTTFMTTTPTSNIRAVRQSVERS